MVRQRWSVFEKPILHGVVHLRIRGPALLAELAGNDAAKLASMTARSRRRCFPGDATTSIWRTEPGRAVYRTEAKVVLTGSNTRVVPDDGAAGIRRLSVNPWRRGELVVLKPATFPPCVHYRNQSFPEHASDKLGWWAGHTGPPSWAGMERVLSGKTPSGRSPAGKASGRQTPALNCALRRTAHHSAYSFLDGASTPAELVEEGLSGWICAPSL